MTEPKKYRYKFTIDTGFAGAQHEEILEFDSKLSNEMLASEMQDLIDERIDTYWDRVDENGEVIDDE